MKLSRRSIPTSPPLYHQLTRFVFLRWIAGASVLLGAIANARWLRWYDHPASIATIGLAILTYNAVLFATTRRLGPTRRTTHLLALAWAQLLMDLGCLTLLVLLTGDLHSPLLGFFVFHVVFGSILLPRTMAFAGAGVSMLLVTTALHLTGAFPATLHDSLLLLGWFATLLLTGWLASGITRDLRRQRSRLIRQNRRIRAMTRALKRHQQAMVQHEKMATAGRMAAGVAHEIANPLASMDGLLQLMERRPERLTPDSLATLREQIARINQIVRRMTDFAHPGDGQWQTLPLALVVDKALEVLRFDPRMKGVIIIKEFDSTLPPIRLLAGAMQQVIVNLVINALDAMDGSPSPRLELRIGRSERTCWLEVADNGPGIGPGQRKRLFEPFFTTKPAGKGTGLGLSISYNLVRTHGGEITVDSREGAGAKFTIRLPLQTSTPHPEPLATH